MVIGALVGATFAVLLMIYAVSARFLGLELVMPQDWNDHEGWESYWRRKRRGFRHSEMDLTVVGFLLVKELPSWAEEIRAKGKTSIWVPGCGVSALPRLLAHLGLSVVATDISRSAVEFQSSDQNDITRYVDRIDPAVPGGSLVVEVHDFRTVYRNEAFDLILNIKAFQGFPVADKRRIAQVHAHALKPGGIAYFDTMNVQGDRRDELESALAAAGFFVPLLELNRKYRQALRATGIPHAFVLGSPIVAQIVEHGQPIDWWDDEERRQEAEEVLRKVTTEYEKRMDEEANAEQTSAGPHAKTAIVLYSTG